MLLHERSEGVAKVARHCRCLFVYDFLSALQWRAKRCGDFGIRGRYTQHIFIDDI